MLHKNLLKYVFIISCSIAIIYPLVNIYIIFPLFRHLLIEHIEEEAAYLAKSLSSIVVSENNELKNPAEFRERIETVEEDFKLERLKVFSARGEIIYSSDPADIGKLNEKSYFYDIVAHGDIYTKLVQSGTQTLEDRTVKADVIETYVPIMNDSTFVGAFEIYYDVTRKNEALNKVAFNSSLLSFGVVFGFFILTIIVLFKADRSNEKMPRGELPVILQLPFYLLIFLIGAIFVSESLVMFFLHKISPQSNLIEALVDAGMLVMIISPFLYLFLLNPLTLHMKKRQRAEEELRKSHHDLEVRVQNRTLELTAKNNQLAQEITVRKRIEVEREQLILDLQGALAKVNTLTRNLEEANARLTELNAKKSDFIAMISHELRTPMTSIKGAMDYITTKLPMISKSNKDSGDLMEFFGVIRKNTDRLISMVNDTLDLERIESGVSDLQFNQIDLVPLIKEVISLQSIASKRNITFKLISQSKVLVFADEDMIRQVLINLVSNALNYSPDNSEIQIAVTEAGDIITVSIKDEGPGIPVEAREKIFDKFYTVGKGHGTGLGLAICRGIIEAHKGIIKVSGNSGGKGNEIYFTLPASGEGGI